MNVKSLLAVLVLTAGTSQVAQAKRAEVEQTRGAVSGLIVGTVAGGPIGGFAGSILGGEVFGRLFAQKRQNKTLKLEVASLASDLKSERNRNQALVTELNRDLDKVLALQAAQPKTQDLPVQFRTASSDIEQQYRDQLDKIARILKRNPDTKVNLWGYADRRGDEGYNQKLSEERVAAIENYLLKRGADREQILSIAYGESRPQEALETLEGNFFDRRVLVELKMDIDPQLATR